MRPAEIDHLWYEELGSVKYDGRGEWLTIAGSQELTFTCPNCQNDLEYDQLLELGVVK